MNIDQRKLGLVLGVLVILGVGIYFYQQNQSHREQEGKAALYSVQKTYEEESNKIPAKEREGALDVDSKFSKTVAELQALINAKKAPARVLFEAALKLGNLYLTHQQPAKAVAPLKTSSEYAKTSFQKASSYYLVGVASERTQAWKDAINAYQKGAAENVEGLKGECLVGLVRANLKAGDQAQAKLFAEKINKDLMGTKYVELASELLKGGK